MFWLKSCPRCSGDLYTFTDIHGTEITCLQCSRALNAAQARRMTGLELVTPTPVKHRRTWPGGVRARPRRRQYR